MKKLLVILAAVPILVMLSQGQALTQELVWHGNTVSIAAAELLPRDNGIVYDTNGVRMATAEGGVTGFMAPVELPQYAYITNVTLEAYDRDSGDSGGEFGGFVKAQLCEYRFNTVRVLATMDTTGPAAPGDVRVPAQVNHLTDNHEYSYGVAVEIFNGPSGPWAQMFYKVIIEYYYPEL